MVTHYQKQISGPLIDWIDSHIQVFQVKLETVGLRPGESSFGVRNRVLKFSRTIADLAGSEAITQMHLAEGLQYWPKLGLM